MFSLGNEDDFPPVGTCAGSGTPTIIPSRRITPTPVKKLVRNCFQATDQANVLWSTDHSEKFQEANNISHVSLDLSKEREMLKQERAKRQVDDVWSRNNAPSYKSSVTPTKGSPLPTKGGIDRMNGVCEITMATVKEVTFREQLEAMAHVHASLITENLLPNVSVELHLLIQLVTCPGWDSDVCSISSSSESDEDVNYFATVHNCVYFAIRVLTHLQRLVTLLDKGTLKLLLENPRIADFAPELKSTIGETWENCTNKTTMLPRSPVGSVSFQADTDNRKNFPNDRCFHLFRKQRDGFYELLREWEEHHTTPGWSMNDALGAKIKGLIRSPDDLANQLHFIRLFQAQLITMCKGDNSTVQTSNSSDPLGLLKDLKRDNPEKFKRLQDRFVMPSAVGGPCPPPCFPGCQEFFRDFIVISDSRSFNQHILDSFSSKILELDSAQLWVGEEEEEEGEEREEGGGDPSSPRRVDAEDREQFAATLLNLRLLAKFVGFVVFLPYAGADRLPETLKETLVATRSRAVAPVDVLQCVRRAYEHGRCVLTLPWVVEYLSMMDPLAPQLEYYERVLKQLLRIYRSKSHRIRREGFGLNSLLITMVLGWLFELPVFPETLFFERLGLELQSEPEKSLDKIDVFSDLIDHQILYTCCPFLGDVRQLLSEFSAGIGSKSNVVRKITPISAPTTDPNSTTKRQLQLQLEESFFHNHPPSTKQCVDFAAERVASCVLKHLRRHVLPSARAAALAEVRAVVARHGHDNPEASAKEVQAAAQTYKTEVDLRAAQTSKTQCRERLGVVFAALLSEETHDQVMAACVEIACRLADEKVAHWMRTNLGFTIDLILTQRWFQLQFRLQIKILSSLIQIKFDQA
ncbi:PREDICTED: codanin-1-like [Priapulus caudatus]|uniref:Codanin-1-like n=1 Tax=Priapulus caudatus TaxID=37621 RepID=A0ABM1EER5_PRICU|nr:PREDICTED: codanin-1-like [Priapulus caudatus]